MPIVTRLRREQVPYAQQKTLQTSQARSDMDKEQCQSIPSEGFYDWP